MSFTLKQLRYFVAAAEAGSVTQASQRLNISQPSVSAAIAELESRFGIDLFIRHHAQGLSLTPAGQSMLTNARSLLSHAEAVRQGARGLGQDLAGELHVGCFLTFAPMIMPRLIGAFAVTYPAISVTLHETHVQGLFDGLHDGAFEIALTYDLNLEDDLDFDALIEVPLHVILAKTHPLAKKPEVSLKELIDWPMVVLSLPQSRDYFLSLLYGFHLQPRIAHETPSFEMVRGLVANSDAFALMHSRPVSDWTLGGRRVVYRPIKEKLRPTKLGLARLGKLRLTRRAEAFAEIARAELGKASS